MKNPSHVNLFFSQVSKLIKTNECRKVYYIQSINYDHKYSKHIKGGFNEESNIAYCLLVMIGVGKMRFISSQIQQESIDDKF